MVLSLILKQLRLFSMLFLFVSLLHLSSSVPSYAGLPQSPVSIGTGAIVGELTGSSVDFAGDVNGDGLSEYISGAPGPPGGNFVGKVYLFDGGTGAILQTFTDNVPNGRFGYSVAGLGDVNGNNVPDFVIGMGSGGPVYVYEANGNLLYTINPVGSGTFGWDVANAGDLTGDGANDILIVSALFGAPGTTYVYNGATGLLISSLFSGNASSGYSVSSMGDATGDGVPEIIVGDPYNVCLPFPPGGCSGTARVYNGATLGLMTTLSTGAINDLYGASVAGAGDYNGDGINDLVVSASGVGGPPGSHPLLIAQVYVYSGTNFAQLAQFSGSLLFEQFGISVGGGDFNKDGFGDILVGTNTWPPPGSYTGKVDLFLGPSGTNAYTWNGASNFNNFGATLATGDFNYDGFSDFASGHIGPSNTAAGSAVIHTLGGMWNFGNGPLQLKWNSISLPGAGAVSVSGGTPNAPAYLIWSAAPTYLPVFANSVLYVDPNNPQFGMLYLGNLNAQGYLNVGTGSIISATGAGVNSYFQVGTYTGGPISNIQLSNGLQLVYVP